MRAFCRSLFVLMLAALLAPASAAQEIPQRRYLPDPSDEDWSFLATAPPIDLWDPVKYMRLGRDGWFATLNGEVRFRPEGLRVRANGARPATIDNYLLQRYLASADVHMGPRVRIFGELQSGIIDGSIRTPRPTDRDTLDLHQAFVEWRQPLKSYRVSAKIGRQEMSIGSTRLISASPGLNVKRSFDGIVLSVRAPTWTLSGAVARLVPIGGGTFDDGFYAGQQFWGVAGSRRSPRFRRGELGLYYLGIDRDQSVYVQGSAHERRHTIGVKWTGSGDRIDLNYDSLFQWGSFGGEPIRGWAFATETGYRLALTGWRPRVSIRSDLASGDHNRADARLESFNPLFPGNSYSGAVGLLGPTNLIDFMPALTMAPRSNLTIGFEVPSYWRASTADGVYATDLRPLVPPHAGSGRYTGTNPGVLAVWQATRHCQLQGAITRFVSGPFLRDTFVSTGFGFYSLSMVYRF